MHESVHRVQFKQLMDLLMQYGDSLTLTRWIAGALLKRTVVMQIGNWSSALHRLTMGPPQGSPLSRSIADLNQDSHSGKKMAHIQNIKELPGGSRCNNWIAYPSGVTTPDLSSVQTRHKHCGALLTQTNASVHTGWNCSRTNKLAEIPWNRL